MSPTGSFPQCKPILHWRGQHCYDGVQKGAVWKAVGFVWKQGNASSRPPAEPEQASQKAADEEAAESVVITLGSPQQIYQHRQAR